MSQIDAAASPTSRHPNFLFVFPDQMRGQALGFLGEEPVLTPNLDRFAQESLVLPDAVSNYPVCSPYRAMLMTGKWPHTNRVLNNCTSDTAPYDCQLQESDRCWSDVLQDQGYSLGYIGKWHLDAPYKPYVDCANNKGKLAWNEWCPPNRRHRFDYWYSYGTYDHHLRPLYWDKDAGRHGFHYVDQWGPEHEVDLAIRYIQNDGGDFRDPSRPFALVVGMNPPHTPYQAVPEEYVARYDGISTEELCNHPNIPPEGTQAGDAYRRDIRHYFAMVTGVDEQFGRIVQAIDEAGLGEETIIAFTSDHGNCLGVHGQMTKNVHYEESMRVPFLTRWPGQIPARQDDLLLSTPDLYPTLLDLMGFGDVIPEEVQGSSLAAIFRGETGERPVSQPYMWVPVGHPSDGRRGIRTHQYTFVASKRNDRPVELVLHDNVADPYQLKNIAAESPEVVRILVPELASWLERTGDPWQQHLPDLL